MVQVQGRSRDNRPLDAAHSCRDMGTDARYLPQNIPNPCRHSGTYQLRGEPSILFESHRNTIEVHCTM
ncbi:MAG: hypothetical protein ABFD50_04680 [Smithella sp.]